MTQQFKPDFIVIDDDHINNLICKSIIEYTFPGVSVLSFTDAEEGLKFLLKYGTTEPRRAIVLLDINMPVISGWEILEKFRLYPEQTKKQVTIYMLSSSIHPNDKDLSESHQDVSGYITKAISPEKLKDIFNI